MRRLPASQLERVEVKPATAVQVVVLGAFSPANFTAINSGVSTLQVKGLTSANVKLQNAGYCTFINTDDAPLPSLPHVLESMALKKKSNDSDLH
jgi:hypothetical protein